MVSEPGEKCALELVRDDTTLASTQISSVTADHWQRPEQSFPLDRALMLASDDLAPRTRFELPENQGTPIAGTHDALELSRNEKTGPPSWS